MKYKSEIVINLPREKMIELFDNPDNLTKWQPGLISFKHKEGSPGQKGAKSVLLYKMGKREIEMTETIIKRNLPEEFEASYEAKGVFNVSKNKFVPVSGNSTKWINENEFRFSGIMSVFSIFMQNAFKKQSLMYLENFKKFAESEVKS